MWYQKFLNTYKAGISHEFILYFNIRDAVDNYRSIDKYIYDEFIKQRGFGIVAFYDISKGLTFFDPAMAREFHKITSNLACNLLNSFPSKIFPYIDMALKNTKMVLFIDHVEKIIPPGDIGSLSMEERLALIWLCEWSNDARISSVGSNIFMMANTLAEVNSEVLRSSYRVEPILVELPNEEERKEYIKYLVEQKNIKMELSIDEFSKLSSGLSKKAIKDIELKAESEDVAISFDFIKEKKPMIHCTLEDTNADNRMAAKKYIIDL
jgi:hypothetical protein